MRIWPLRGGTLAERMLNVDDMTSRAAGKAAPGAPDGTDGSGGDDEEVVFGGGRHDDTDCHIHYAAF